MNLKNYMLSIAAFGLACSSAANAQAIKKVDVVEILNVQGKVLVERLDGSQYPAQKGAILTHGSKMMMLAGSSATAKYMQNKCEVAYKQNQVVNIRQDKQCSAGVSVINANQYAKFGNGANPGCCVVKTVTVPGAVVAPAIVSAAPLASSGLLAGASTTAIFGGLAGIGLLSAISNNSGGSDPTPVDPTPVDPTPVDPTPVDPTPVDPTPVDPTPVDPTPVDPTPVDPTPVDPTPVDPTPVDPTPVNPTPVNPTPVNPTPVNPNPVGPIDPIDPIDPPMTPQ